VKAETALIVADTNELQTDDVPGLIATLDAVVDTVKAETALIVADTNELQTDNVPGLIATLDAVVDTVKVDTAAILVDTAEIGAAGAGLTALATQASVNTIDGIVDSILVDTGTTIPATITTIDNEIATIDTVVDRIEVDTQDLQTQVGTAGAGLSAIPAVDISATAVDDIWDEQLTVGSHNIGNSAGRRLREVAAGFVLHQGTAQAGATNTITLDTGANATDDFYNHTRVVVEEGTGLEQERIIVDYNGTTKVATIAPPWVTNPDATSVFVLEPALSHAETNSKTVKVGLAAAATSTTITLSSDASTTDDYYNDDLIEIDSGTGEGQARVITDYVGSTKVATVDHAWITTPDTTSEYIIEAALPLTTIVSAILAGAISEPANGDEAFTGLTLEKVMGLVNAHLHNKGTLNRSTGAFALRDEADTGNIVTGTDSDDGTTFTKGARS